MSLRFLQIMLICVIFTAQSHGATLEEKYTPVPNIKIDLKTLTGHKLYDEHDKLKSKLIVLHFWATWCPKCHGEMPKFDKLAGNLTDNNILLLAPSIDTFDQENLAKYYASHGIKHLKMTFDPKLIVAASAKIIGVPTTLFINSNSEIIGKVVGAVDWDRDEFHKMVNKIK